MACARCGREPDADMIRFVTYDGNDEIRDLLLCPECSYGFNTLLGAYVANRLPAPGPA